MAQKEANVWTLQDAKNRFSELVRDAIETGPQTVTRHGEDAVVVISAEDYARERQSHRSLWDVMREHAPGFEFTFERDPSGIRRFIFPDDEE